MKFKPIPSNCKFLTVHKQTVKCVKKIDKKPALFEMDFEEQPAIELQKFRNIEQDVIKHMPECPEILNKFDVEWDFLNARGEERIGNEQFNKYY